MEWSGKTELVVQRSGEGLTKALEGVSGVTNVKSFTNGSNRFVVESEARDDIMAELAKTVVNQGAGLIRMSPVQLALEEYYLGLIGGRRSEV